MKTALDPTGWRYSDKPSLANQRTPTPNDWLARNSLQRSRVNPITYALAALVIGAVIAWRLW